jgi:hypothetical protein
MCSLPAAAESADVDGCSAEGSGTVRVLVRAIQASSPTTDTASLSPLVLEDAIADLQPKLAQLPFRAFKLLSAKQEQLEVKHQETVTLPNGQTVSLRPMFAADHRVGLWLNWLDTDGSEILNTRLHFDTEDSLVTGTDSSQNEGLLLAIKAVPVDEPPGN